MQTGSVCIKKLVEAPGVGHHERLPAIGERVEDRDRGAGDHPPPDGNTYADGGMDVGAGNQGEEEADQGQTFQPDQTFEHVAVHVTDRGSRGQESPRL